MAGTMDWLDGSSATDASSSNPGFGDINFGAVGSAASDLFGSFGDKLEAGAYKQAQHLEEGNEWLTAASTQIQEVQATRKLLGAQGATQAAIEGAGFTVGGSGGDLLRSNAEQGSITKQLIQTRGNIEEQNFAQKAAAYGQMATAARNAAQGGLLGAALQGGQAALPFVEGLF